MIIEYLDNKLLPELKRLQDSANSIRYRNASMNFYNDIIILRAEIENILKENKAKEKLIEPKRKLQFYTKEFITVFKRYDGEIGQAEAIWQKSNDMVSE